jgi:hypothetical protein
MVDPNPKKDALKFDATGGGLSMLEGMILDGVAAGKSPRTISAEVGLPPADVVRMAYDLLDREIVTDIDQRRKLQVYRLEKLVEALWQRTMANAEKDDVKNLREVLSDLNVLLALNKEQDATMLQQIQSHQFQVYMQSLMALIMSFKMLAPDLMTQDQWQQWSADQLERARDMMKRGEIEQ